MNYYDSLDFCRDRITELEAERDELSTENERMKDTIATYCQDCSKHEDLILENAKLREVVKVSLRFRELCGPWIKRYSGGDEFCRAIDALEVKP